MTRTALALILCLLVSPAVSAQTDQAAPLSLEQITNLVTIPAPDAAIAAEIKRRGLGFKPSEETIRELTRLGAGASTLAAIRARIPAAQEAPEVPTTGSLDIVPSVAGATIEIAGVGRYDSVHALHLKPGSYRVTVSCPLCEEISRTVTVTAGRAVREEIEVPIDRVEVQAMLSGALSLLQREDYKGALENAEFVLGILPREGRALRLASESAYMLGMGDELVRYGSAALLAGDSVRLPVRHKRRLGEKLLNGWLTMTANNFEFEPEETGVLRGGGKQVATAWSALRDVTIDAGDAGEPWLVLVIRNPKGGKEETLRLAHPDGTAAGRALDGARRLLLGGIGQQGG